MPVAQTRHWEYPQTQGTREPAGGSGNSMPASTGTGGAVKQTAISGDNQQAAAHLLEPVQANLCQRLRNLRKCIALRGRNARAT